MDVDYTGQPANKLVTVGGKQVVESFKNMDARYMLNLGYVW